MTCSTLLFGIAAAAAALSAEVPVPEVEAERQPGLIRITGIDESDRVLLDGELMGDGKRLMRFGSKLFVNPGQYTLTVLTRNNQTSCVSHINVRENETATARCSRSSSNQDQNVY